MIKYVALLLVIFVGCFLIFREYENWKSNTQAQDQFLAAATSLRSSIEGKPDSVEVGDALIVLGEQDAGVAMLERLADDGDDPSRYLLAVRRYLGMQLKQDLAFSEKVFREQCDSYIEPCAWLAGLYMNQEKFADAEKAYLKAARSGYIIAVSGLYELYLNKKWEGFSVESSDFWKEKIESSEEYGSNSIRVLTKHILITNR